MRKQSIERVKQKSPLEMLRLLCGFLRYQHRATNIAAVEADCIVFTPDTTNWRQPKTPVRLSFRPCGYFGYRCSYHLSTSIPRPTELVHLCVSSDLGYVLQWNLKQPLFSVAEMERRGDEGLQGPVVVVINPKLNLESTRSTVFGSFKHVG